MIKSAGILTNGRKLVILGFTEENWARLRAQQPIRFEMDALHADVPMDVYCFAGADATDLIKQLQGVPGAQDLLAGHKMPGTTPETLSDADLLTTLRVCEVLNSIVVTDAEGRPATVCFAESAARVARTLRTRGVPLGQG